MPVARLADRAVLKVSGVDAPGFVTNLVTCDLGDASEGMPVFGGLLTPQGKILFDFVAHRTLNEIDEDVVILDTAASVAADFVKRLSFYKLRAKVFIEDITQDVAVLAGWDAPQPAAEISLAGPDPRLEALGWRAVVNADRADAIVDSSWEAYHAHRIALGVPEGGKDFLFGEAFPHEALMDQLAGVDFEKGCYIGQEVVSRMQHRGTARTRILPARYADDLAPETGVPVEAGDRAIGTTGSAANGRGLVMVRLDRAADALAAGTPLVAGGRPLTLERPRFARFETPGID